MDASPSRWLSAPSVEDILPFWEKSCPPSALGSEAVTAFIEQEEPQNSPISSEFHAFSLCAPFNSFVSCLPLLMLDFIFFQNISFCL